MEQVNAPKVLAIIPARGGSKGIKGKNIKDLAGKPLLAWTIEASLNSTYITKTIVSSDDHAILAVASEYGADTLLRPDYLATDAALTIPVVEHVLESMTEKFDYFVLLQPTSPLRESRHIDEAFEKLLGSGATSLISVIESDPGLLKSFIVEGDYLKGAVDNHYPFMRRQDLPKLYRANGAIYIVSRKVFLDDRELLTQHSIPYAMDDVSSIDIDVQSEFDAVEKIISATVQW